ncbi:MAG: hypothetical protein ABIO95_05955 [Bdellovibrionota bacterium]
MRSHLSAIHKGRKSRNHEDHENKVPANNWKSGKNATQHLSSNESEKMIAKVAGNPLKVKEHHYRGAELGLPADSQTLQAAFQTSRSFTHDLDENDDERMSSAITRAGVYREEGAPANGPDIDREFALEQEATHETISANRALEIFNDANDDDLELVPEKDTQARNEKQS